MSTKIVLSKIEVQNYRSCIKTVFEPTKTLSALIGVNASGKSNVLNAVLLLKKLIRPGRRGGYDRYAPGYSRLKVWFTIGGKTLPYEAFIRFTSDERNRDDVFFSEERWNFREFTGKNRWVEVPLSLWRKETDLHLVSTGKFLVRDKYGRLYRYPTKQASVLEKARPILTGISEFAESITYYSASQFTDPSKCPASLEIDEEGALRRSALRSNEHVEFIYDLYQHYKKSSKRYAQFLSLVGRDGINLVDSIRFTEVKLPSSALEVKTGGKMIKKRRKTLVVIPSFVTRRAKLSPNQLSEGTFKTLALIFYLITEKSKLLLLEEPEVCVHHGLLTSIVELVKAISAKKQIILSTHSDFVLDMLKPTNVFLVQNHPRRGTLVKHIPKSLSAANYRALKDYLSTSGNLGEYWRQGGLDQ